MTAVDASRTSAVVAVAIPPCVTPTPTAATTTAATTLREEDVTNTLEYRLRHIDDQVVVMTEPELPVTNLSKSLRANEVQVRWCTSTGLTGTISREQITATSSLRVGRVCE